MMSDEEKIESSLQDGEVQSLSDSSADPGEVNENNLPTGQAGSQEQVIESPELQIEQREIPLVSGTTNSKLQTEEMEVHHHPKVEKKNFKEYLLEGLMIFFAVSLGFIAENMREDITEHQRAKAFASSMIEDLKADTGQLKNYIKYFTYAANNVDTFMRLLSKTDPKNIPPGKLYWYGLWGGARNYFVSNDATFQQIKSSGSLSLFKPALATDIAKYDRLCRLMQANDQMNGNVYTEVRKTRSMIFDFRYNEMANQVVQKNKISYSQARLDSFMNSNPPLLTHDKSVFNQYVELVRSRFLNSNVAFADSLLNQATLLLDELNKEYNQ